MYNKEEYRKILEYATEKVAEECIYHRCIECPIVDTFCDIDNYKNANITEATNVIDRIFSKHPSAENEFRRHFGLSRIDFGDEEISKLKDLVRNIVEERCDKQEGCDDCPIDRKYPDLCVILNRIREVEDSKAALVEAFNICDKNPEINKMFVEAGL